MSRILLVTLCLNLAVSAATATLVSRLLPPEPKLGVLDIAALYRQEEQQISRALTERGATPEAREDALRQAAEFGDRLEALIADLPKRCDCLVLARGAVIGARRAALDLTADVQQRLRF